MADHVIPTLVIPATPDDGSVAGYLVGLPRLLVNGEVVPWPTTGDWRLDFSDGGFATLTLTIPVRVDVEPT